MPQSAQPAPFTRLNYPDDPKLNAIIQDIYNKLGQVQATLVNLQTQITKLTP